MSGSSSPDIMPLDPPSDGEWEDVHPSDGSDASDEKSDVSNDIHPSDESDASDAKSDVSNDSLEKEMFRQADEERAEENRRAAELEATPQAELTSEQTAQIQARPRKVPKLRLVVHPPRQPSSPQPANSSDSPEELESQSVAEPLQNKGKGKEVPRPQREARNGDLDALKARATRQAEQIATLTRENGELRAEAISYMADVARQRQVEEEEREQMKSAGRALEQRLNAQIQKATRCEERLIFERRVSAAVLRERAQEQERREKELTDQLQQLRAEQLAARSTRTSTKGRLDQFDKLRQTRKDQKVSKRGLRQDLEKKLEASRAKTGRLEKASQTAEATLQARQNEVKELGRRNGLLERQKEVLSKECQRREKETEELKEAAREAGRRADRARDDADEMAQAKKEAETKASSSRSETRTRKSDKKEFAAAAGSTNATLTTTSADLQGARDRLAELETAMTRKEEKIRGLETFVDGRCEAWEETREESEGGREKIPWWKVFLTQLFLWIFFGLEKWEENAGGSEIPWWNFFWTQLTLWVSISLVVLGVFMISADQKSWHRRVREDPWSEDVRG